MKDVLIVIAVLLYVAALTTLTCYMVINHGWYWIFLLLLANVKVNYRQG